MSPKVQNRDIRCLTKGLMSSNFILKSSWALDQFTQNVEDIHKTISAENTYVLATREHKILYKNCTICKKSNRKQLQQYNRIPPQLGQTENNRIH